MHPQQQIFVMDVVVNAEQRVGVFVTFLSVTCALLQVGYIHRAMFPASRGGEAHTRDGQTLPNSAKQRKLFANCLK